jgi:hypothetical protein
MTTGRPCPIVEEMEMGGRWSVPIPTPTSPTERLVGVVLGFGRKVEGQIN